MLVLDVVLPLPDQDTLAVQADFRIEALIVELAAILVGTATIANIVITEVRNAFVTDVALRLEGPRRYACIILGVRAVLVNLTVPEQVFAEGFQIVIIFGDAFIAEVAAPVKGASIRLALLMEVADVAIANPGHATVADPRLRIGEPPRPLAEILTVFIVLIATPGG